MTEHGLSLVAQDMLRAGFRGRPSLLETTFDIAHTTVSALRNGLFSSLRYERELVDERSRRTYYRGSPHSPAQLRIYDKTHGVVRVEVILRSSFLRAHDIDSIPAIHGLRDFDFSRLLRFVERRDRRNLSTELSRMPDDSRKRLLLHWPRNRPLQFWASALRFWGAEPTAHLVDSPWQALVRAMQQRLVC